MNPFDPMEQPKQHIYNLASSAIPIPFTGSPQLHAYPAATTAIIPYAPYKPLYPRHPDLMPDLLDQQNQQIKNFWADQNQKIKETTDFKHNNLPLARIKKIMKEDEDVHLIRAEVLVLFARACEMFIVELTHRSWIHVLKNKRQTLQKSDISKAISGTEVFDFLIDIVEPTKGRLNRLTPRVHMDAATSVPTPNLLGVYYYVSQ